MSSGAEALREQAAGLRSRAEAWSAIGVDDDVLVADLEALSGEARVLETLALAADVNDWARSAVVEAAGLIIELVQRTGQVEAELETVRSALASANARLGESQRMDEQLEAALDRLAGRVEASEQSRATLAALASVLASGRAAG